MRYHTISGWLSVLSVLFLSVISAVPIFESTPSPSPWDEVVTKHRWDAIPDHWVSLGRPPNGTTIRLHIALKANHENALIDAFHEISHPSYPKYGAHLSREQVAELVAPHPDTLKLVFSWLEYNGVPHSSISTKHGGGWLTIAEVPVSKANEILRASYELYCHAWTNETILRTAGYALPTILHLHVKTVAPTTAFTSTRLMQQTPLIHSGGEAAPANVTLGEPSDVLSDRDDQYVEPSFLRWLYRMPFNDPAPTDRNKLGIAGLANEFPSPTDLESFITSYRSDVNSFIASTRIMTVVPVNNGVDARNPGRKRASIDTQYSVALTFPTQIKYYTIGGVKGSPPEGVPLQGDQYLEWLHYMIDLENVPQTISVPYSTRELDLSTEYVEFLCNLFKALGSRGVSVLVASGDQGVGRLIRGRPRKGLVKGFMEPRDIRFSTTFPASCPWVTSVGGTKGFNPEMGSKISGGGFSVFFDRPPYQHDAVNPFLSNLESQYSGRYNPLGRGVPDIALQSMDYAVLFQGETSPMSSTSFSTNTAAAIIALLNDFLIKNNRPPLGFLNYWLYEAGLYWNGLNDIIEGKNPGCATPGFSARVGWDPVTGLGSLNYTLLERHLIKWL